VVTRWLTLLVLLKPKATANAPWPVRLRLMESARCAAVSLGEIIGLQNEGLKEVMSWLECGNGRKERPWLLGGGRWHLNGPAFRTEGPLSKFLLRKLNSNLYVRFINLYLYLYLYLLYITRSNKCLDLSSKRLIRQLLANMPVRCNGRKILSNTHLQRSQQLYLYRCCFWYYDCCSSHKRMDSLMETRMTMLDIYSFSTLSIKFQSYILFYNNHGIYNIS
jgi:hypothetical protein